MPQAEGRSIGGVCFLDNDSGGGIGAPLTTPSVLRRAIKLAGVEFIDENGGGPGVRLRKRQRAKSSK